MKKYCFMLLTALLLFALILPVSAEAPVVNVGSLKGPTAMGMAGLMEEAAAGAVDGVNYQFTIAGAVDEITAKIVKGELNISAVPANLASVLYNNTKGQIEVLAINTLGMLYIVDNGDVIHTVEDLRGKTIFASGKGATPEYALNYLLKANGIDPAKDVTIEWKTEHAECVAALVAADHAIAMLPQPFVTIAQLKNDKIRIALDMTKLWDETQTGMEKPSALITGVIVAQRQFVENNPDLVTKFLAAYQRSVDLTKENPEKAAELIGMFDIVPTPVAKKALPFCNITLIDGDEMKTKLGGYLQTLLEQNPKAIGGTLPDDAFYYLP